MTTGRKLGGAVVLVALVAGVLWWMTRGREAPPEVNGAHVPSAVPAAPPPRETKARVRSATSKEAEATAASATGDKSADVPDVTGVVTGADRESLARGEVSLTGEFIRVKSMGVPGELKPGERSVLLTRPLRDDGTFEIASWLGVARDVDVVVNVPGFRRAGQRVTLQPGTTQRVELRVERGLAISGAVVKADGVPVPGLRLLVRPATYAPRVVTSRDLDENALRAAKYDPAAQWAQTVTDEAGRFTASGLGEGKYTFYSEDPAWILRTDDVVPAGTENVRVVARPAQAVVLHVKDAATGKALTCSAALCFQRQTEHSSSSTSQSVELKDGELRVWWDKEDVVAQMLPPNFPDEPAGTVSASLRFAVEGYNVRTVPLALDATGPLILDVELDPVIDAKIGHLRLEVVDGRGEPVDYAISAWLRGDPPDHKESETNRLSKEAPGRFVLGASPGRWTMTIRPPDAPLGNLDDERRIEVVAGGSTDLRIVMPPSGHVVVRRKTREGPMPELRVGTSDGNGSSVSTTTDEREIRWRLQPRTWRIVLGDGDAETTHDVAVRAYEESVLETDR